jgi:hypothetical protein
MSPYARSVTRATGTTLSDAQLEELALAADPDLALDDDAVCLWDLVDSGHDQRLPEWYMPGMARSAPILHGWRRGLVIFVIASFLLIDAYGLCNTYGWVAFG